MKSQVQKHTVAKSLWLHIFPGIVIGACYFALAPVVESNNFPSAMALIIAGLFILLPLETWIIYRHYKASKNKLFGEFLPYTQPLKPWTYIICTLAVIILSGLAFKATSFLSPLLMQLFEWLPRDMILNMGLDGSYSKQNLILTYILFFITIVVVLPIVEELYFRGFLLPRMPTGLKGWAVPLHSILFALYHLWTPWMIITRTIGVLPLVYVVKRTKNIYVGMAAHILMNSIDFFIGLAFILSL